VYVVLVTYVFRIDVIITSLDRTNTAWSYSIGTINVAVP